MNKSSRFLCSRRGGFAAVTAVAALGLGLLSLAFGVHVAPGRASESGVGPEPAAVFSISALGRIEPSAGVIRIAGPSRPGAVVADLRVEAGDRVDAGQLIAVLDDHDELTALVKRLSTEQRDAAHRRRRFHHLHRDGIISTAEREAIDLEAAVKEAELDRARAQLATSLVRAPGGGTVLDIVARRGERVGPEGIAILADTARMDVAGRCTGADQSGRGRWASSNASA
jgi:HlyD family secretion protein